MVCEYRFIDCYKGASMVGNIGDAGGCVCVRAGLMWAVSLLPAHFCCQPTTALKHEVC